MTAADVRNTAAAQFRYRAATDSGVMVDGVLRAASREAALRELRRQRLWPVTVDAAAPSAARRMALLGGAGARRRAIALWTRTLATLLDAGAPMDRALRAAESQVEASPLRETAHGIATAVQGGASLAEAMRAAPAAFSALHAGMVEAGERAGQLPQVLETLAGSLEDEEALRADVRTALLYPLLMACVATLGILVLLLYVVPRFSALLADLGGTLPLSTRLLVATGAVIGRWWWLLLIGATVGTIVVRRWLATPDVRAAWHAGRLRWPLIGSLERTIATARYARALGLLLRGGVSLLPAMRLSVSATENEALRSGFERAAAAVARGEPVAQALDGTLTPLATQLLQVGDESGRLESVAWQIAGAHETDARRTVKTLTTLLEPALILLFGALVGFVALAMLQAIYAINTGG
jgi:general secretion pathway protein F